jgi:DNA polymerase-3 subunit delta'
MAKRHENLDIEITTPISRINQALAGSLETGRVSHAYLFAVWDLDFASGEHNTTSQASGATAFAARLNCQKPQDDVACGRCLSCRLIQEGNHPDVKVVSPDGLFIKIDQIRGIQHDMSYKPRYDKGFRVTILENAEKMTQEAQNSFLKLLEEPPRNVVFILVTGNPQGLLPTVRSRCQLIRVSLGGHKTPEDFSDITERLRKAYSCSSLEVLEEAEAIEKMLQAQGGAGRSRAQLEKALAAAAGWFRDVLVFKETGDISLVSINPGKSEDDIREALSDDGELYEVHDLIAIIERIEESRKWVRQNANIRLVLESLLFDLRRRVRQGA